VTSLMSTTPGGLSEMLIISSDMGAETAKVAILQFVRLLVGIGFLPFLISRISPPFSTELVIAEKTDATQRTPLNFTLTLLLGGCCGVIGKYLGIPAGALIFSLIGAIIFNLKTGRGYIPRKARRFAQVLSGTYIGSDIFLRDVQDLSTLLVPAIVIILGYMINCIITAHLLHKFCGLELREGMLASTPAGASDMALISADLGAQTATLIGLQILRMLSVTIFFPQIIFQFIHLVGG